MLICPVCKSPLLEQQTTYQCSANHSFDKSRTGYINLLLANMKNSKQPGDNKQMVQSRATFLNKGHYAPISQLLNTHIQNNSATPIIDIGCGNGYYLKNLKNHLAQPENHYFGVDISKEAIHLAAKEEKDITWIVSSIAQLPCQSHSTQAIISIFSPQNYPEFQRVLADNGYLYMIAPAENHLYELRERLFADIKNIANDRFLEESRAHFTVKNSIPLQYTIHLSSNEEISSLFSMTPYYWRCTAEKRTEILSLEYLSLTIHVLLWIFKKA